MTEPTGATTAYDQAAAYAEMCELIDHGYLRGAMALAKLHGIPLSLVWAPQDDGLDPVTVDRSLGSIG